MIKTTTHSFETKFFSTRIYATDIQDDKKGVCVHWKITRLLLELFGYKEKFVELHQKDSETGKTTKIWHVNKNSWENWDNAHPSSSQSLGMNAPTIAAAVKAKPSPATTPAIGSPSAPIASSTPAVPALAPAPEDLSKLTKDQLITKWQENADKKNQGGNLRLLEHVIRNFGPPKHDEALAFFKKTISGKQSRWFEEKKAFNGYDVTTCRDFFKTINKPLYDLLPDNFKKAVAPPVVSPSPAPAVLPPPSAPAPLVPSTPLAPAPPVASVPLAPSPFVPDPAIQSLLQTNSVWWKENADLPIPDRARNKRMLEGHLQNQTIPDADLKQFILQNNAHLPPYDGILKELLRKHRPALLSEFNSASAASAGAVVKPITPTSFMSSATLSIHLQLNSRYWKENEKSGDINTNGIILMDLISDMSISDPEIEQFIQLNNVNVAKYSELLSDFLSGNRPALHTKLGFTAISKPTVSFPLKPTTAPASSAAAAVVKPTTSTAPITRAPIDVSVGTIRKYMDDNRLHCGGDSYAIKKLGAIKKKTLSPQEFDQLCKEFTDLKNLDGTPWLDIMNNKTGQHRLVKQVLQDAFTSGMTTLPPSPNPEIEGLREVVKAQTIYVINSICECKDPQEKKALFIELVSNFTDCEPVQIRCIDRLYRRLAGLDNDTGLQGLVKERIEKAKELALAKTITLCHPEPDPKETGPLPPLPPNLQPSHLESGYRAALADKFGLAGKDIAERDQSKYRFFRGTAQAEQFFEDCMQTELSYVIRTLVLEINKKDDAKELGDDIKVAIAPFVGELGLAFGYYEDDKEKQWGLPEVLTDDKWNALSPAQQSQNQAQRKTDEEYAVRVRPYVTPDDILTLMTKWKMVVKG